MESLYNTLKSLRYKMIFLFFYGLIFAETQTVFAVQSDSNTRELKNLKSEVVYETQQSNDNVLMLNAKDFADLPDRGPFMWAPFVLPIKNLTITNAMLFMGGSLIGPPKEGSCELFQSKNTDSENKTFLFVNKKKQKRINTSLFFILSAQTHERVAIARLNSKGESRCLLPAKSYLISTGFGRNRKDTRISGKSTTINLNFPTLSTLRVNPTLINNIQNGDIIRIGRKINFDFTKTIPTSSTTQSKFDTAHAQDDTQGGVFPEFHFPTKITPDLYVNADMLSHDLAVDEYLHTSFLVGSMRYQIELEPGNYVIAVLRKTKVVCFNKISLQPDSSEDLSCSSSQNDRSQEDVAYQFESAKTIFDIGFRPKSLIHDQNFVSWTLGTKNTILLGPPILESESLSEMDTLNENDFFSLVFKNSTGKIFYQTNYGASLSECIEKFNLPLVGMSQAQFFAGQVPFSEYINASSQNYRVPYFLNQTNVQHTNGAEISIMGPVMTRTGVLFATTEQDFLVRIKVPQWNSTNTLEMYINRVLYKRWLLKRGNTSEAFSTIVKIKAYESDNFVVKFAARGELPLPNFLTGRNVFTPFAETREFCVSLDGKELCP